jgi:hypothetical protein
MYSPLSTRRASPLHKQTFGGSTVALLYRDLAKNERRLQEANCTPIGQPLRGGAPITTAPAIAKSAPQQVWSSRPLSFDHPSENNCHLAKPVDPDALTEAVIAASGLQSKT